MRRNGGTYKIDKKGKCIEVTPATRDHPEGNTARTPDGTRLDRPIFATGGPVKAPAKSSVGSGRVFYPTASPSPVKKSPRPREI